MNKRSRGIVAGSAVLAVAGLAMPVAAQQQAGGNGRALDANTQVGSGGTNAVQGQVDYRARNDVVTGNVSGGRGFQGSVNYSAPGEFRGNLGSNQLFDYRARSLGSSPLISDNVRNAALSARGGGGQSAVSVYRGFSGVTGFADEFGGGVVALDGGSRGIFSASSLKVGGDISPLLSGSTRPITGDTLGAEVREDGGTTVFSASPLLGIRRTELPALSPYQPEAQIDRRAQPEEDPLDVSTQPALDFGLGETSRIEGQRVGQMAGSIVNMPSDVEPGDAPPGLVIGQQLQSLLISNRAGETLDQRVQRLESMIFKRTDPAVNRPGSEVYKQLIEQLREQSAKPAEQQQPMEEDTLDIGLEEVEEEKLTEAEKIAADAMKRAYEVYGTQKEDGEATDGVEPAPAEGEAAETEAVPESIDKLLSQLRTDLPRVGSLAADAEDRANKLMKQAEAALAAGEYFDAEAMYRQAKINAPQNPLATVGLIHAQMGAGLIRSASANLHKLFEEHPELINVRYEADVLPPKDRLQWVQGELQRMIDAGDHGGQPGLLLAYLGHQTQSRQLIRYGIAVAEANAPRDALLGVLRGVWLDDEKAPAAQGK
jgi:tetratricopeptide (TPR) repeat protein